MKNILDIKDRSEFRRWLETNGSIEDEVWVNSIRCKPQKGVFAYIDAVEEALCFGWIDSVWKNIDGVFLQRFSPRRKDSYWTELNKERARRLERLGAMRDEGRRVLPPMGPRSFKIDADVEAALKKARCYKTFKSFPALYQRVRAYNVAFFKKTNPVAYQKQLEHFIAETKKGKMYGEWNDYGRLL